MTFSELSYLVVQWASDRKILQNSKPEIQLLKTVSELGELADAMIKHDRDEVIDGLGDVLVTLIIVAAMQGISLEAALTSAYDTIKDRRGYLSPTGAFIKEGAV